MPHSPVMSKIRCPHPNCKSTRVRNRNYLMYIATREGVDLTDTSLDKNLAEQALSIENLDDENMSTEAANNIYVKYIAERPRSHGLFGSSNVDVTDVKKLSNEMAELSKKGVNIYRGIVSLSGQDAIELGYDKKENWENLMHEAMPKIAEQFNIPIDKFAWTAAVHDEKSHPHVHYMFWRTDDAIRSNYIHISTQNKCREIFSGIMFEAERHQEVINKTTARDLILDINKNLLDEKLSSLSHTTGPDKLIKTQELDKLSSKILNISTILPGSGRYAYKFLPPERKEQLDAVVNYIKQLPSIQNIYRNYISSEINIAKSLSKTDEQIDFMVEKATHDIDKRIANQVLRYVKQINTDKNIIYNFLEQQYSNDIEISKDDKETFLTITSLSEYDLDPTLKWSKQYKEAIANLYSDTPDYPYILKTLHSEHSKRNVLATEQLAKIYEKGIGVDMNIQRATQLYTEAFSVYQKLNVPSSKMYSYINYKLGKLYEQGHGTEKNEMKAYEHYMLSANLNNKFAQYSVYNLLMREKITADMLCISSQEHTNLAITNLKKSADQNFGYAAYSYAKHISKQDSAIATKYYKIAFNDFTNSISNKTYNDDILYRVGTMYYEGNGTEQDSEKAFWHFQKAAEYNNQNAIYALGKTYADTTSSHYDVVKAEKCFTHLLSDDEANEKPYIHYALAKLYIDSDCQLYNMDKGIDLLTKAASLDHIQSMYTLGCIYSNKGGLYYKPIEAEKFLHSAYLLGNSFASYKLACLYLDNTSLLYNPVKGLSILEQDSANGNINSMAKLGSIYLFGQHNVRTNVSLGLHYLTLASDQNSEYAMKTLEYYNNYKNSTLLNSSYSLVKGLFKGLVTDTQRQQDNEAFYRQIYIKNRKHLAKQKSKFSHRDDFD